MSADEMCGDYPAPCNCDDPETHDGAVTATDRPSVTDNARADVLEQGIRAFIRHGQAVPADVTTYDREAVHADLLAVIDDANRAAGRAETITVTDQALAEAWAEGHRTGWEHCQDGNYGNDYWDDPTPNPYAATGRAETTTATTEDALDSLPYFTFEDDDVAPDEEFVRKADVARLLATTRTRPTREELARAIAAVVHHVGYEPDHPTPNRHDYRAADAVLALLRGDDE